MKWYALHVLTNSEIDIKNYLMKKGYKSLVPRRQLRERRKGIWVTAEKTLFPGYVFVYSAMDVNEYYMISGISGVVTILRGASNYPEPLSVDEALQLQKLTQESDLVGMSDIIIESGNMVKVINGPLFGYEGSIIKVDRRRQRAKVRFTIVGKETEVELGINVLDKI